ncbi:MAG: hypothetical protein FWF83_07520, partial [Clostridiales bacterium]|nr:hypothetical protein [Clostridiales bacterium]
LAQRRGLGRLAPCNMKQRVSQMSVVWKRSLFGYREEEVNAYLSDLAEARAAELSAIEGKIDTVTDMSRKQEAMLAERRDDAQNLRSRLNEVESTLILTYYRIVHDYQALAEEGDNKTSASGGQSSPRRESMNMAKQGFFGKSLMGVSPHELETYLLRQEQEHEASIKNLSDKLNQLEKALATQSDEIQALGDLMAQPEMQRPFIDLAERLLARIERAMGSAIREPMMNTDKDAFSPEERERMKREDELRLQISRSRRMINALIREVNRQEAGGEDGTESAGLEDLADVLGAGLDGADEILDGRRGSRESENQGYYDENGGLARSMANIERLSKTWDESPDAAENTLHQDEKPLNTIPDSLRYHYLMDKQAGQDIIGHDGRVLAKKGETVTLQAARTIHREGLMEQLILSF